MIELVFNSSASASLRWAMTSGSYVKGPIVSTYTMLGETPEKPTKEKIKAARRQETLYHNACIQGNRNDVAVLELSLDMGELSFSSLPSLDEGRKALLHRMQYDNFTPEAPDRDAAKCASMRRKIQRLSREAALHPEKAGAYINMIHQLEDCIESFEDPFAQFCRNNEATLQRLQNAAKTGETVRIWWGMNAHEACGFYFAVSLLADSPGEIHTVCVSRVLPSGKGAVRYRGTGELRSEAFGALEAFSRPLTPAQRQFLTMEWRTLQQENAPLRVLLNGRVISAPEDFYDSLLRQQIPAGEFFMGELLGKVVAVANASDWWLYQRALKLIEQGILVEVKPRNKHHPYSAVLKRA